MRLFTINFLHMHQLMVHVQTFYGDMTIAYEATEKQKLLERNWESFGDTSMRSIMMCLQGIYCTGWNWWLQHQFNSGTVSDHHGVFTLTVTCKSPSTPCWGGFRRYWWLGARWYSAQDETDGFSISSILAQYRTIMACLLSLWLVNRPPLLAEVVSGDTDGLAQDGINQLLTHWSYCNLALNHRYGLKTVKKMQRSYCSFGESHQ